MYPFRPPTRLAHLCDTRSFPASAEKITARLGREAVCEIVFHGVVDGSRVFAQPEFNGGVTLLQGAEPGQDNVAA